MESMSIKKYIVDKKSTAQNIVISPNFQVWKFCGKTQFPQSFGGFAVTFHIISETVPFHKISTPGYTVNYGT